MPEASPSSPWRAGVLGWVAAATAATACASPGFPPGGPQDLDPPVLAQSEPADRAVNATTDQEITLVFDDILDYRMERELSRLIVTNPSVPEFEIELDDEIVVLKPQGSLIEGITYSVTLLPGLEDRDGNASIEPRTLLFGVGGVEPITLSLVRATIMEDTLPADGAWYRLENTDRDFRYDMVADSLGRVSLEAVAYGTYVATAWREQVRPDGWQITEEPGARDTFELSTDSRAHETTYAIAVVDTTAPIVTRVETPTPTTVRVRFDDVMEGEVPPVAEDVWLYLADPDLALAEGQDPDSLPIERVRHRRLLVTGVQRPEPSSVEFRTSEPLFKTRLYRIEIVGMENVNGLTSTSEGGRTFRPRYRGPAVWPSTPIPWPPELR